MNTSLVSPLFTREPYSFDDAFRSFMRPFRWDPPVDTPQIFFDIAETDVGYFVRASIPGVPKDMIHVEIEGAQVMITAEFKKPADWPKDYRPLHSELRYGFASRVFTLGYEIDRAKAVAKFVDGVLMLTLPKKVSVTAEPLKIL
jgi:HSP20 family protein